MSIYLISDRIKKLYQQLVARIEDEEKRWFESKIAALETQSTDPKRPDALNLRLTAWDDIVEQIRSI